MTDVIKRFREKFVISTYPFLGGQRNYWKDSDEMKVIDEIENFITEELQAQRKEIIDEWLSLDLRKSNQENWEKELTKFSLFMQKAHLKNKV